MLRPARAERGGEDYDHRNSGGPLRAYLGRNLDLRPLLARERTRNARVAGHLAAGNAPVGKTYRARDHRTVRQLLPPAALVRGSARSTTAYRESRLLGGKTLGRPAPAA